VLSNEVGYGVVMQFMFSLSFHIYILNDCLITHEHLPKSIAIDYKLPKGEDNKYTNACINFSA
jgi:hypothetical protein